MKVYTQQLFLNKLPVTTQHIWQHNWKIPIFFLNKRLILIKGLFYKSLLVKHSNTGLCTGRFVSMRKPFVRPVKSTRR